MYFKIHTLELKNCLSFSNITFKITSSGNTTILMYSNSSNLVKISFIGLLCDFFAIAQIPTKTCFPSPSKSLPPMHPSSLLHPSDSSA